jgi:large subunit ribosomal protein L1
MVGWLVGVYGMQDGEEATPYRNQDETMEVALNLNIDPRKPGQALRGSLSLPHGTGKKMTVLVFTADDAQQQTALDSGAAYAGGKSLVQDVMEGRVPLDNIQRILATADAMPLVKSAARLLGPKGLMPNAKVGTLLKEGQDISKAVQEQLAGQAQYRTDKNGIVHLGIGRYSMGHEKLQENLRFFFSSLWEAKPESYGKGKKKAGGGKQKKAGAKAKYFLRAFLTSSQQKGSIKVDVRTIEPTSPFFMIEVPK